MAHSAQLGGTEETSELEQDLSGLDFDEMHDDTPPTETPGPDSVESHSAGRKYGDMGAAPESLRRRAHSGAGRPRGLVTGHRDSLDLDEDSDGSYGDRLSSGGASGLKAGLGDGGGATFKSHESLAGYSTNSTVDLTSKTAETPPGPLEHAQAAADNAADSGGAAVAAVATTARAGRGNQDNSGSAKGNRGGGGSGRDEKTSKLVHCLSVTGFCVIPLTLVVLVLAACRPPFALVCVFQVSGVAWASKATINALRTTRAALESQVAGGMRGRSDGALAPVLPARNSRGVHDAGVDADVGDGERGNHGANLKRRERRGAWNSESELAPSEDSGHWLLAFPAALLYMHFLSLCSL